MSLKLPQINIQFWLDKNEYYSDQYLSTQIQTGLSHAKKAGLIEPYIVSIKSNAELVELILRRIRLFQASENREEDGLIIFDLIQSWGGATGRSPYVRPKNCPPRPNDKNFGSTYISAIDTLIAMKSEGVTTEGVDEANRLICDLPYVSESFSTKHLQFWSLGLDISPRLAIYDSRMILLVNGANKTKKSNRYSYLEFLDALHARADQVNQSPEIVERALFAFSKNFFPNDSLVINDDVESDTDYKVAQQLERWWNQKAPSSNGLG